MIAVLFRCDKYPIPYWLINNPISFFRWLDHNKLYRQLAVLLFLFTLDLQLYLLFLLILITDHHETILKGVFFWHLQALRLKNLLLLLSLYLYSLTFQSLKINKWFLGHLFELGCLWSKVGLCYLYLLGWFLFFISHLYKILGLAFQILIHFVVDTAISKDIFKAFLLILNEWEDVLIETWETVLLDVFFTDLLQLKLTFLL